MARELEFILPLQTIYSKAFNFILSFLFFFVLFLFFSFHCTQIMIFQRFQFTEPKYDGWTPGKMGHLQGQMRFSKTKFL